MAVPSIQTAGDLLGSHPHIHAIASRGGRRGDGAEAERLLRQALAVRRRILDAEHWRVAVVELALGQALALQGRAGEGVAMSE
ncbi:MAG TPA: tetratricopeptide repeat protein, partial [Thermoanaerobaculia bacterium]|nr:tetratricopeptide repeat protein [Thermoanaerobaculia bacterium]